MQIPVKSNYWEIHQSLPDNPLASMVNLTIVGNLPITTKGFAIVAKGFPGFPGSWISPVFALASIGF